MQVDEIIELIEVKFDGNEARDRSLCLIGKNKVTGVVKGWKKRCGAVQCSAGSAAVNR